MIMSRLLFRRPHGNAHGCRKDNRDGKDCSLPKCVRRDHVVSEAGSSQSNDVLVMREQHDLVVTGEEGEGPQDIGGSLIVGCDQDVIQNKWHGRMA